MRETRIIKSSIIMVMLLCLVFSFAGCGKEESSEKETNATKATEATAVPYTNADGQTQEELNSEGENFYGKWSATSEHAKYLYGNLDLTINEDGTFDANVTDIDFTGTWEKTDDGITFDSEYITGKMYFGEKCKMVIYEDDIAPITLEKQE